MFHHVKHAAFEVVDVRSGASDFFWSSQDQKDTCGSGGVVSGVRYFVELRAGFGI